MSKYEDAAFELGVMSLPFFGLYRCVWLDVVLIAADGPVPS